MQKKVDVAHSNRELTQKEEMQKNQTGHNDAQQTVLNSIETKEKQNQEQNERHSH